MGRAFEVRKAAMAKTSLAKAKVYSRFGKEVYMAAKGGVADPEMNPTLKRTIEKAKANQVPADVIKRAIEKAKGGSSEQYSEILYEGFGAGESTILVECLTDNTNRSIADVRSCFNKAHAKLGNSGAVSHGYEKVGLLAFSYADDTFNPYQGKNFDVSFRQNNSAYGAKKFLKIIKNEKGFSKVVSILKKVSQYTSDIRVISMIFLPYIFGKFGVSSLELKLGMSLAVALTCLVIEKSISTKKNKKLNEEIDRIKTFLNKEKELENVEQLTNILDEISDDT